MTADSGCWCLLQDETPTVPFFLLELGDMADEAALKILEAMEEEGDFGAEEDDEENVLVRREGDRGMEIFFLEAPRTGERL